VSFEDYRPISCCNVVHKIIANVLARQLKPILSEIMSKEQFGFLKRRQICDAVIVAQEVFHSAKRSKQKVAILKLDLSKAYNRVD
jgi:hypothetical protein